MLESFRTRLNYYKSEAHVLVNRHTEYVSRGILN